uniref:Uncharacterized protein n=1 Tax=Escherichia coli TaxID=562 RepID=A0A6G6ALB6_ECOLX|nr:hypothetical protein [Escherichia coli]UWM21979.1 hypothetical protein [Morganella morganii]UWM22280.1 hypothetical protein [Klebsiella pneumoniae]QID22565.1 hypothetical protein [Escherichia coli]QID23032.1 hypothetical protein [Escherichia coli]
MHHPDSNFLTKYRSPGTLRKCAFLLFKMKIERKVTFLNRLML